MADQIFDKVAVLGAGAMGNGIAHVCAVAGYQVMLWDVDPDNVNAALARIDKNLQRQVESAKITKSQKDMALSKIKPVAELDDCCKCGLIIEAVVENENIKKSLLKQVSEIIAEDTLLASNTSSLSITGLAAATKNPEKFVGIHFMNPVPIMELVELIRGIVTDDQTFTIAKKFIASLDKTAIIAEDFPAFIVNRILLPMINEAIYTLYEGVASVDAIDKAMKLGAHHPMGPLQLADFIGLDTCLAIMQVLYEGLADSKYRPCPLLVKYVEAGWLGRKAGRGFYDYRGEEPVPTR